MSRDQADRTVAEACARGIEARAAGDLAAAETSFRAAAEGGDPDAAVHLGLLLVDRGDVAGAVSAYQQGAAAGSLEATLNLAALYAQLLDRPDDARKLYESAIESGDMRAIYDYGFFLWREGEAREAERAFQRAIEAGDPRGSLLLGFLLDGQRRDEDALTAFEQAAASGVEEARTQVGLHLLRLGKLEKAEQGLRRVYAEGDLASAEVLHDVLEQLGRADEAETVLQEAIDHAEGRVSIEYRDVLASYDGERLYENELKEWASENCNAQTPLALAALLFDAGRLARAETRLKLAIEHGDDEASATLAKLYEKTGRQAKRHR